MIVTSNFLLTLLKGLSFIVSPIPLSAVHNIVNQETAESTVPP